MKISTKLNKYLIIAACCFTWFACGPLKGEFAYKQPLDDHYKKLPSNMLEIKKTDTIEWVYKFSNASSRRQIGVVLLKKEIVWVDIKTTVDYIDRSKKVIFGTIENLPVGDYYIQITDIEEKKSIDMFYFTVYSDNEL